MTDSRRASLTRQAGALISGALASRVFVLLLLMASTRLVPKAELGAYQQLGLIFGILSPLLVAGIPAALLYFIPRADEPSERRSWVGAAYLLLGLLGMATSIAFALGREPIAVALGNPQLAGPLLVYAPYPFFAFVGAIMPTALVAVHRSGRAALLNALTGGITVLAVLAGVAIKADASHMAAGLVAGQACSTLISTYFVYHSTGIQLERRTISRASLAILKYGLPLALTGLAGKFAFQFDRLVVSRNFTPATYAVYVVGAVELPISVMVQQAVNSVLVPALARHYHQGDIAGMAALWRRAIRNTSLVLLPVFVFFMLTARETVHLLFGSAYDESVAVFRVYLLLVPLRVATYGLITQAIGRTHINLTASFVLLASNAVLVLALVGPLGLIGPALGTVLATFTMALYYLARLRGVLGMSLRALFPWSTVSSNMAIAAVAGVPVAILTLLGVDGLVQIVAAAAVYAPSYLILLLVARRLTPQELDWGCRRIVAVRTAIRRFVRSHADSPA